MATDFPTSLDSLTNPTSTDRMNTVSHADQHANANDAIEALEAKVGIDGSGVSTSHDYKIDAIETKNTSQDFSIAINAVGLSRIQSVPAFQHVITLLDRDRRDINVLVLGDSVTDSANTSKWVGKFWDSVGDLYPSYTIDIQKFVTTPPYDTWDSASTINAGTGSNTLTVFNAAQSATRSDTIFGDDRMINLVRDQSVDLIMFAHCHNEGDIALTAEFGGSYALSGNVNNGTQQTPEMYMTRVAAVLEEIRLYHPSAPVVIVGLNPEQGATADDQDHRAAALARLCTLKGYSWVDLAPDMYINAGWPGTLMEDNLHPTTAGHQVMADSLLSHFRNSAVSSSLALPESDFTVPTSTQLLTNPHLTQTTPGTIDSGWTLVNTTVSKDTGIYEGSKGYSAKLESNATGSSARCYQQVTGASVTPYLGKWLTFGLRVYVPTNGSTGAAQDIDTVGTIRLLCVGQYSTAPLLSAGWRPLNGWHWVTASAFIPTSTSTIQIDIFVTNQTNNADALCYVDRCVLVPGIFLKDIAI